ncbi:MAG: hypothetical protein ACI8QC_002642 [Planctomycetota bacterium]|jgi:hypothetical protein
MRQYSLALLASLALAPSAAIGQSDLDALIPQDAFFVVRTTSLDNLLGLATSMTEAFIPGEPTPDLASGFLGHLTSLSQDRPAAFAASLRGGEIVSTMILPTSDAAAMQAEFDAAPDRMTTLVRGGYVGSCDGSTYEGGGAAFMQDFPKGMLAMRLDLSQVFETYGPLIEMGMDQGRMMMDQTMEELPESGMDMGAIMDVYFDAIDDFILSAEVLDMSFGLVEGQLTLEGALQVGSKSPMGRLASTTRCDLMPMAKRLHVEGSIGSYVMGADYGLFMDSYLDFMGGMMDLYPDDMRGPLEKVMQIYSQMFEGAGPGMGGTFDMNGGMNATYFMQAEKPTESLAKIKALYSDDSWQTPSIRFNGPQDLTIGSTPGFESRLFMDMSALMAEDEFTPDLQPIMDAMYGKDGYPMWFGATGEHLVMAVGPKLPQRELALQALEQGTSAVSPGLKWAIESMGTSTPSMAIEMDMAAVFEQMLPIFAALDLSSPGLPSDLPASAPFTEYFVIDGPVWRGGMRMPLKPWAELIRAFGN